MLILMRRTVLASLLVLACGTSARAQHAYGYAGYPGYYAMGSSWCGPYYWGASTAQGDILRGEGMYLAGLGQYWRDWAVADSILYATAERRFLLEEEYIRQQDIRYARKLAAERAHLNAFRSRAEERLRNHPEVRDVLIGDALNVILSDLSLHGEYLQMARTAARPVNTSMLRDVSFQYFPSGRTITLAEVLSGPFVPQSFRRDVVGRDQKAFEAFIARVAKGPEVSVGELITFMNTFGLRFAPAEAGGSRGLYMHLQSRLAPLRREVMERPAPVGDQASAEPVGGAKS